MQQQQQPHQHFQQLQLQQYGANNPYAVLQRDNRGRGRGQY
jgi:hypothetical protein